ncbi:acetylglutamate kinase [bacterium B17]|nr:acetylglutamate kinase [bacterium B17]
MDQLIKKADVLIEALPYIQEFRDSTIVVKFGGSAMESEDHIMGVLEDICFMECVGMNPVIVHGGGKAISRGMKEEGIAAKFVDGLRVTCEKTISVVEKVIKGEVNPGIVKALESLGAKAVAVHGEDIFKVVRKKETCDETGAELDWGFVGVPEKVDATAVIDLVNKKTIPVVMPLGMGPDGKLHNINADTAAGALAKELKARKIAYLSDVPGLLSNPDDPKSLLATLKVSEVEDLIKKGVIAGGMLPKIESGVEALHAGVRKVHLVDGTVQHSLLLEIFTDKGVGTEIISNED